MASEQEKILQQRDNEILNLRQKLDSFEQTQQEIVQLRTRNEESDKAIQSKDQSIFQFYIPQKCFNISTIFVVKCSNFLFEQTT